MMRTVVRAMLDSNVERVVKAIVKFVDDCDPRVALGPAELLLDRAYRKPTPASVAVSFSLPEDTGDTSPESRNLIGSHSPTFVAWIMRVAKISRKSSKIGSGKDCVSE